MPGDGPGPGRMTGGPYCPHQPSEHTLVVDAPRCHCVPGAGVQAEQTPPVLQVLGRTGPSRLGTAGHEGQVPPLPGNTVPWPQKRTPAPHVHLSAAPPACLLPTSPAGALTAAHIPAPGAARPAPDGGCAPFPRVCGTQGAGVGTQTRAAPTAQASPGGGWR